jgi:hypothetical protein
MTTTPRMTSAPRETLAESSRTRARNLNRPKSLELVTKATEVRVSQSCTIEGRKWFPQLVSVVQGAEPEGSLVTCPADGRSLA